MQFLYDTYEEKMNADEYTIRIGRDELERILDALAIASSNSEEGEHYGTELQFGYLHMVISDSIGNLDRV